MSEKIMKTTKSTIDFRRFILLTLIATLIMSFVPMLPTTHEVYAAGSDSEGGDNGSDGGKDTIDIQMDDDGNITNSLDDNSDSTGTWNTIFQKYKVVVAGVSGIAAITFILLFILNFVKIGSATDNPQKRNEAIRACLWTGIAAAGCGSVTAFTALFWNAFK